MTIRKQLLAAALASACTLSITTTFAKDADSDHDCDDMMKELRKLSGSIFQSRTSAKTPLAICGVIGQLAGVAKASRAVADECYDDDDKKGQEAIANLDKMLKEAEGQLGGLCK